MIGPLLPTERGRGCRPTHDNRRFFEGMMWMARTGSQWRQLPDEYGKWKRVPPLPALGDHRRVRRHAGNAGRRG
ncbi:MAG: transposase [Alphaproteobacteria bacterium]|nr:MAG: transposase [Alphaproteobacteria bacterium]